MNEYPPQEGHEAAHGDCERSETGDADQTRM
jgi:hypothetical protein